MSDGNFDDTPLGRRVEAVSCYTPSLLHPIQRQRLREGLLPDPERLPFDGCDLWTAWELSWLDRDGKPEVGVVQIRVPCRSYAVFESKSLKLYLNSFSQTAFASAYDVARTLESDLSVTAGMPLVVDLLTLVHAQHAGIGNFTGECLDTLPVTVDVYRPDAELLGVVENSRIVTESVYSNLLRSLCPVTGQPDIGSIQISYSGMRIDHEALLRYIVSYREHQGFHEQCVERIFLDILHHCRPRELSVYARYNRRGGIDINPFRSTVNASPSHQLRLARQ
ncbi:MAG: NADPH-dependent 7-cyano-7-deazaguanine reductase QueF [Pseudomonadales bacterium]|jgi:7-cyano-7-deazaguanine reductase|nr:NADPH-dependent 7-cyano-7-deazaguanine reductase QueF [Pseudomonadales bacterium]MCP5337481.1 NADPH-dependent 7-cyano-7-deazaguanine reductase QueF [Pseudomonadales bacterium]